MKKFKNYLLFSVIVLSFCCLTDNSLAWELLDGRASAISISPSGEVFILGKKNTAGGRAIYQYTDNGWVELPGGGVAIAAGPNQDLWVVDNQKQIFRYTDVGWQQIEGNASDIAVGFDGSVYSVGTTECGTGFNINRFIEPDGWEEIPGCGTKIDVSPEGIPWVINRQGRMFKPTTSGEWQEMPGSAYDIALGGDDEAWVTGTSRCHGGRKIFHYQEQEWIELEGCAVTLDIAPDSTLWVVNSRGEIFRQ